MKKRFWSKVDQRGPDECWPWTASTNGGYGAFGAKLFGEKKMRVHRAHRVAFFLATGVAPDDLVVCHSCDNPPCCNPAHLWLGTQADNNRDMSIKGRNGMTRKTHCPQGHKYTDENVYFGNNGGRYCRQCGRNYRRAYKARMRARP